MKIQKKLSDNEILAECALQIDKRVKKILNELAANTSTSL